MTTEERISIRYGILKEHANFAAKAVLWTAADGNAFCFWRIEFVFDLSSCPTDESMDPLPILKNVDDVYNIVWKYSRHLKYYSAYVYLANNVYYLMEELLRSLFCTAAAEFPWFKTWTVTDAGRTLSGEQV